MKLFSWVLDAVNHIYYRDKTDSADSVCNGVDKKNLSTTVSEKDPVNVLRTLKMANRDEGKDPYSHQSSRHLRPSSSTTSRRDVALPRRNQVAAGPSHEISEISMSSDVTIYPPTTSLRRMLQQSLSIRHNGPAEVSVEEAYFAELYRERGQSAPERAYSVRRGRVEPDRWSPEFPMQPYVPPLSLSDLRQPSTSSSQGNEPIRRRDPLGYSSQNIETEPFRIPSLPLHELEQSSSSTSMSNEPLRRRDPEHSVVPKKKIPKEKKRSLKRGLLSGFRGPKSPFVHPTIVEEEEEVEAGFVVPELRTNEQPEYQFEVPELLVNGVAVDDDEMEKEPDGPIARDKILHKKWKEERKRKKLEAEARAKEVKAEPPQEKPIEKTPTKEATNEVEIKKEPVAADDDDDDEVWEEIDWDYFFEHIRPQLDEFIINKSENPDYMANSQLMTKLNDLMAAINLNEYFERAVFSEPLFNPDPFLDQFRRPCVANPDYEEKGREMDQLNDYLKSLHQDDSSDEATSDDDNQWLVESNKDDQKNSETNAEKPFADVSLDKFLDPDWARFGFL